MQVSKYQYFVWQFWFWKYYVFETLTLNEELTLDVYVSLPRVN